MQCVFKSDFASLQSFWVYLYRRFFSQMNSESLSMAYKLETNVLRCGRSGVVSPPSFLLSLFLSLSLCLSLSLSLSLSHCRLFLVQASRTGRQDEVRAFFEKMSDSLHDRKEWKDWFGRW